MLLGKHKDPLNDHLLNVMSQFAYVYNVLKVCTVFVEKKYILLSV